ncbi:hypothetical protein M409DRAFT_21111 [Zasmidium cellare ATCC 36951]|uniref:DUF7709 domain-containing protein n=1 Tax=Zasmidium cellare ATCC 36951 TaxID=1080233 RepID=A0A6A6CRE4_ZASCE|nr:uncharacterized protein M409DRAFT_21111 [Zasmidium cellare ATCC 36951]KAF2168359.1 hypothetical protein M409DRAFT_21111 [Zasmidium cellare ATCC 36951]
MSQDQEIEALHDINKRLLKDQSSSLPAITLADGTKIQTGTVGALIQNIKLYDRVCAGEEIEGLTKDQLEQFLTTPIPTLHKSGLLDIFPPDEWIAGGSSEGRKFVGRKAKEQGY